MSGALLAGATTAEGGGEGASMGGQRERDTTGDIKDYVETTMNELLGWYGYDKVDSRGLNLKAPLRHRPLRAHSSSSSSPIRPDDDVSDMEDTAQSSPSPQEAGRQTPSTPAAIVCGWCQRPGLRLFVLRTPGGDVREFCSEPCFSQCRRAAFKRNRACNWCRHVRHAAAYVDLQDGDDQLQFCSDKCLNQYKMHIFCRETQAYLQAHPHLLEEAEVKGGGVRLITPDLWLRDCGAGGPGGGGGVNGGGDERPASEKLEDLSATSRRDDHGSSGGADGDQAMSLPDKRSSSALASFLVKRDESDSREYPMDRRKRHQDSRDSARKRQRLIPSHRKSLGHLPEAPPAHLSSAFPSNSIFPSASAARTITKPLSANPPLAHSTKQFRHNLAGGGVLPPSRLPPPPPLLNNSDFHRPPVHHPHLLPPFAQPQHHHQLEAFLRLHPNVFPDLPLLPGYGGPPVHQPSPMMLPYPIFVPLPVPVPVPIPITAFLPKNYCSSVSSSEDCTGEGAKTHQKGETADGKASAQCQEPAAVDSSTASSVQPEEPTDLSNCKEFAKRTKK